jgi:hypothetical protein
VSKLPNAANTARWLNSLKKDLLQRSLKGPIDSVEPTALIDGWSA